MPWIDGVFRPRRSSGIKCSSCGRPFAEGSVPSPDADGRRVCRDCRWAYFNAAADNHP